MGFWIFSMYSWVYSAQKYTLDYEEVAPKTSVFSDSQEPVVAELPKVTSTSDPRNNPTFDRKVSEVRRLLKSYNAPLAANAEDFVRAAEIYKIDYRLMPSISIVESSGGKHLFRRYNPFGWGSKNYPSFKVAIYDVARGLGNYYKAGRDTPEEIGRRYNPVTPTQWAGKVRKLMGKMASL